MSHERRGESDEWYTPKYIFDALGVQFTMDVAAPVDRTHCHVPANLFVAHNSLESEWKGFIWMNPPYGHQSTKRKWLRKFMDHGCGVALVPDRTSAPWWQEAAREACAVLFVAGKIKFIRPDGSLGKQPGNGTTLFASGDEGVHALEIAERNGLGIMYR